MADTNDGIMPISINYNGIDIKCKVAVETGNLLLNGTYMVLK